nr:DUF3375 family protein [Amycolatopsis balhimycina]
MAESIKAMQRDVVAELRHDVRPTGEVLREYLARGQRILDATPEGRAFAGALRLIGDPAQIDDLWSRLRTVLRHRSPTCCRSSSGENSPTFRDGSNRASRRC